MLGRSVSSDYTTQNPKCMGCYEISAVPLQDFGYFGGNPSRPADVQDHIAISKLQALGRIKP